MAVSFLTKRLVTLRKTGRDVPLCPSGRNSHVADFSPQYRQTSQRNGMGDAAYQWTTSAQAVSNLYKREVLHTMPPSSAIVAPLTYAPALEERKMHRPATSAGCPILPSGT